MDTTPIKITKASELRSQRDARNAKRAKPPAHPKRVADLIDPWASFLASHGRK